MKIGTLAYIPPADFGFPDVFLANLRKFKTRYDLLLYSARADIPGAIKIGSPDELKSSTFPNGRPNPFAVNNAVFYTGMRIALKQGYTHVIYAEADCRVGRNEWDAVIFDEYFNLGRPTIAAGSLVAYNPCTWSAESARRWNELILHNPKRNFPVATYGWQGASGKPLETCLFPNGALGVYDTAWIAKLFDLTKTIETAKNTTAWDMHLGIKLWQRFQEMSYDLLGMLYSIYSGFGDVITCEEDRRELLTSGKCVAVHQIKSDWTP